MCLLRMICVTIMHFNKEVSLKCDKNKDLFVIPSFWRLGSRLEADDTLRAGGISLDIR